MKKETKTNICVASAISAVMGIVTIASKKVEREQLNWKKLIAGTAVIWLINFSALKSVDVTASKLLDFDL